MNEDNPGKKYNEADNSREIIISAGYILDLTQSSGYATKGRSDSLTFSTCCFATKYTQYELQL